MNSQKTKTKFVKKGCSNYKAISLWKTMKTNLLLTRGNVYLGPCSSTSSEMHTFFIYLLHEHKNAMDFIIDAAVAVSPSSCSGCQFMSNFYDDVILDNIC